MSSSVRPRQENMQNPSIYEDTPRWKPFDTMPSAIRSQEETEALIERLNANLNARMEGNPNIPNSLATLHRMRASRTRYLRPR